MIYRIFYNGEEYYFKSLQKARIRFRQLLLAKIKWHELAWNWRLESIFNNKGFNKAVEAGRDTVDFSDCLHSFFLEDLDVVEKKTLFSEIGEGLHIDIILTED